MDAFPYDRAPTLETPRLRLRAHTPQDFEASYAMWSDPEVVRFIGGRPTTREDAWGRLLRYAGHWSMLGYGFWAVEDKATGRLIGDVGLGDFRRDFDAMPEALATGAPEAGWAFATFAHGRGFGAEAVNAALAWSDAHLNPEFVYCIVHPDNVASLTVAGRSGFVGGQSVAYRGEEIDVLIRPRPEAAVEAG